MPRIICGTLLLFASMMSAQQQRDPPSQPPYATPPTFPESKDLGQRVPPDTPAPRSEGEQPPTSAQIAQQIQQAVDNEPLLKDSDLKVKVDDTRVTLTGIVASEKEREIALSAAALYAGKREIVDQIKIRT